MQLKLPIFVVQIANAAKNGIELRQNSIDAVRCSPATSYDDWQCHAASMKVTGTGRQVDRETDGWTGPHIESG